MLSATALQILATALFVPSLVAGKAYTLSDNFQGTDFLNSNNFAFITEDPSNGYVYDLFSLRSQL